MYIKKLSDETINQIKAGEVVDRPLNVVKECVENSCDAGATNITVELLDGGKRLIKISDNGHGIPKDQLSLALERHATSKISDISDLEQCPSFGFRGEALASISAVSNFYLRSKTAGEELGFEISHEQGIFKGVKPVSMSVGTVVSIKDLFINVPARLKFLRTTSTEFVHIQEFMIAMAFVHYNIEFTLIHNGRNIFSYKKSNSFEERAKIILGPSYSEYGFVQYERGRFKMMGLCSLPEVLKPTQNYFYTFINQRFVKDKCIRSGIVNGYEGLLMKDGNISCIVSLQVDPTWVDVNAHPSKTEVRFYDAPAIQDLISQGVQNGLKKKITQELNKSTAQFEKNKYSEVKYSEPKYSNVNSHKSFEPKKDNSSHLTFQNYNNKKYESLTALKNPYSESLISKNVHSENIVQNESTTNKLLLEFSNIWDSAKYIGQYLKCYLIFQINEELWFVDQHAYHERILYEEISSAYSSSKIEKQILLTPHTVLAPSTTLTILSEHLSLFDDLGFECAIGDKGLDICSFPTFIAFKYIDSTVLSIIDKIIQEAKLNKKSVFHDFFATMACHSAVRSGENLDEQLVKHLMGLSKNVDFYAHCPHGRPVIRKFTADEISRWFERI